MLMGYSFTHRSSHIALVLVFTAILVCGCSSAGAGGKLPAATPTLYHPFLALQVCLDNTGSYSGKYREAAQKAIADRIDSLVQPNIGGMAVFVSQIAQNSFQNDVLNFSVPAIAPLPIAPTAGSDPYTHAQKMRAYKKALPASLEQLHSVQTQVKVQTDKLRNLRLTSVGAAAGTDIPGCLASASEHFSHVSGGKTLLLISDMQNNQNTQYSNNLDLRDVTVRVLYRTCQVVSTCQQNDASWTKIFKRFGAASVEFYDPASSEALHITF